MLLALLGLAQAPLAHAAEVTAARIGINRLNLAWLSRSDQERVLGEMAANGITHARLSLSRPVDKSIEGLEIASRLGIRILLEIQLDEQELLSRDGSSPDRLRPHLGCPPALGTRSRPLPHGVARRIPPHRCPGHSAGGDRARKRDQLQRLQWRPPCLSSARRTDPAQHRRPGEQGCLRARARQISGGLEDHPRGSAALPFTAATPPSSRPACPT